MSLAQSVLANSQVQVKPSISEPSGQIALSQLSTEDLRKIVAEKEKALAKIVRAMPTIGFKPHLGQERFIRMLTTGIADGKDQFGCFTGNRWGKTQLMMNIIWNIASGAQNQWFQSPLFQHWPYPKRIRLGCHSKQLKDFSGEIARTIDKWWPKGQYKSQKQGYDYPSIYLLPNDFVMDVLTYDQDPAVGESVELGAYFFDEPPTRQQWFTAASRFSKGGFRVMFGTLLFESAWIQEDVITNPNALHLFSDIHDNCADCGRGYLKHVDIDRLIANYAPEEREARQTGRPIHLRGRVFEIEPSTHFVGREQVPKEGDHFLVVDPHQRRPWVILIGKRCGEDYYIVDEWPREPYHKIFADNRGIEDYVKLLREFQDKYNVQTSIIDSKFAAQTVRKDFYSTNLRQILEWEHGLAFEDGNTHVEGEDGGVAFLRELLRYDKNLPVDFTNKPQFFVCRDLFNTTYQLQSITWKEYANPDQYGKREKLDDAFLDYPRCCMYLVMHDLTISGKVANRDYDVPHSLNEMIPRLGKYHAAQIHR